MSDNTVFRIRAGNNRRDHTNKEACLIMIDGDFLGQVFDLNKDVVVVGRTDEVDIVLSDIGVSRRHAMITQQAAGYFAADLGSTNGTLINNEKISEPRKLNDGDKIRVSDTIFKFSYQDAYDTEYLRQLRELAVQDGLTRIYNHRYFMETIKKEFGYSTRSHSHLSLIIFDIDHFKDFNDNYGHPTGDAILKSLARLIETEARDYDVFARYGGEEFAFLLRGSDLTPAIVLAERIRKKIADHVFEYDGQTFRVTVSLGVATYDGNANMKDEAALISAADQHLYEAKRSGRNRTCYTTNHT